MLIRFKFRKSKNKKIRLGILYCTITIDGITLKSPFSTGIQIEKKNWDTKNQKIKNSEAQNNELLQIKTDLIEIYNYKRKKNLPVSAESIKAEYNKKEDPTLNFIQLFEKYLIHKKTKEELKEIKISTYEYYEKVLKNIVFFFRGKSVCDAETFDNKIASDFEYWLKTRKEEGKFKKTTHNSAMMYLSAVKEVLKWGKRQKLINMNPLADETFTIGKKKKKSVLSREEFNQLKSFEFKTDKYRQVKDMFVFMCYTGFAFADLYAFEESKHTVLIDDKLFIQKHREKERLKGKTEQIATLPYFPEAQKIKSQYPDGFPFLPHSTFANLLSEICSVLGIDKRITTHVARKSALNFWLEQTGSFEIVAAMAGHTDIRITQQDYAKVGLEMVKKAWQE